MKILGFVTLLSWWKGGRVGLGQMTLQELHNKLVEAYNTEAVACDLTRTLDPVSGYGWTLAVGLVASPKVQYYARTIDEVINLANEDMDATQPTDCTCEGFHDGSCRYTKPISYLEMKPNESYMVDYVESRTQGCTTITTFIDELKQVQIKISDRVEIIMSFKECGDIRADLIDKVFAKET